MARRLAGRVVCTRGGLIESVHRVHVVAVDAHGRTVAVAGDPRVPACLRSVAKPFQALALVEDGVVRRFRLSAAQLAICCASHNAEARHLRTVRALLEKAGVGEGALECGPHAPMGEEAARRLVRQGVRPGRIHNNCSGKHAGMLALAAAHGWPTRDYRTAGHPVQRRMLAEVARWTAVEEGEIGTGVDGCGVVCFTVPLAAAALAFARFAAAAAADEPPRRVVDAMTSHPFMVAGTGRLCTEVMERTGGRVFLKTGAEGVYGAGVPERGLGVAVKVEDGAGRASGVVLLHALATLEVITVDELEALAHFARPQLRNTRNEITGELRAEPGAELT